MQLVSFWAKWQSRIAKLKLSNATPVNCKWNFCHQVGKLQKQTFTAQSHRAIDLHQSHSSALHFFLLTLYPNLLRFWLTRQPGPWKKSPGRIDEFAAHVICECQILTPKMSNGNCQLQTCNARSALASEDIGWTNHLKQKHIAYDQGQF